jgi:hypothetical protein
MLAVMAEDDSLVVIASHLRPEEAGMLQGLLESAGIPAVVRDDFVSSVHPFLQPIIGGVKLAVLGADVERAREIIRSAGVLPGPGPREPVEIPEEEWSRAPEPPRRAIPLRPGPAWPRRAVVAAPLLLALAFLLMRCLTGAAER